jgi:hypothetical protein
MKAIPEVVLNQVVLHRAVIHKLQIDPVPVSFCMISFNKIPGRIPEMNGVSRVHFMFCITKDMVIPYDTICTPLQVNAKKSIDQAVRLYDTMFTLYNSNGRQILHITYTHILKCETPDDHTIRLNPE